MMTDLIHARTAPMIQELRRSSGLLQRQCACGNHTVASGECAACAKKKSGLQRKLAIGANNDPLEREADRVADQVLAASSRPAINNTPPHIQRSARQASEGTGTAPDGVDRVLASAGRPLDPVLQQDMGQRFGYDFSRVRVHSDAAAEQSAREVNAKAYTVGNHIVFGAGHNLDGSTNSRLLLAHELTHVLQQTQGNSGAPSMLQDPAAEDEAARASEAVRSAQPVHVSEHRAVGIARQPLSDEEKIRQALGLPEGPTRSTPPVVWLGKRPTWFGTNPKTPITYLGQPPSADLKKSIDAARTAPAPRPQPMMQLLPPPRTAFEAQAFKKNMRRLKDPKTGAIIGFFAEESGVFNVYDIEGKKTTVGERPLESPLIDPIDLIPFELIGSLAAKTATTVGRGMAKTLTRAAAKEAGVEGAEITTRAVGDLAKAEGKNLVGSAAKSEADEFQAFQQMLREEGASGSVRAEGDIIQLGPHGAASQNRSALGVSGRDVQSAHGAPQSVMKGMAGYNPNHALTKLMDRGAHTGMDRYWKEAFQNMRRAGQTEASAQTVHDVVVESIRRASGLSAGERNSLIARLSDEMFVEFGLKQGDMLTLPYPNIKPAP